MKKFKSFKTLKFKNGESADAEVMFTQEAVFECEDASIILDVEADLIREVPDYIGNKKETERFTIADTTTNTVITGFVTGIFRDYKHIEYYLLVTNVYANICIVNRKKKLHDHATV